ncbi:MAG: AGE family epimerase/isomerase [Bacteroidota bacterium]
MRTVGMVVLGVMLAVVMDSGCRMPDRNASDGQVGYMTGQYWKDQVINDILPYWTEHARDTVNGGFYTTLDSAWKPFGDTRKYPSMLSRHIFGFSVGYLLSGDQKYLDIARETVDYLLTHAWDPEYGGWYDVLDESGNPLETTKSMFIQVYSITGLAMYYFVTRDTTVLSYIEKSNNLLESKAWDREYGGYFNVMTRDWQVFDNRKSISSEITPVSGYLLYLYLATHDQKYLDQCQRILDRITTSMTDPESGWILENFTREWRYLPALQDETEVSVGHNIEVAWMLCRYYQITGQKTCLDKAGSLTEKIYRFGNKPDMGFWYNTVGRLKSGKSSAITYWWVQAYGIMFDLYACHAHDQDKYLDDYRKGAMFWDSRFVDRKNGDTHFSVLSDGTIRETLKANQFKSSYHNAENGLLNYLYLNTWVNHEPVELYFYLKDYQDDSKFYFSPIEGENLQVSTIDATNKPVVKVVSEIR